MSENGFLSRLLASAAVPAAVEITSRRVTAVGFSARGPAATFTGHASEPLPAGLVTPALNSANVHESRALAAAVAAAVDRLSPRPRRIALVLPDTVAKVSLVRFEKVPARTDDLNQLIRWQVRKAAPFRIEDAQVAWTTGGPSPEGGQEYLVVMARRDIIESYERACDLADLHAGVVDIASLNLVNAVLATAHRPPAGDWLLVRIDADGTTLVVVRGDRLISFRSRPADPAGPVDIGDLVHQTAMYHEDRLGGAAFARVVLSGASAYGGEGVEPIRRQIEERLGVRAELLDVRGRVALRDRIVASAELLDSLAPAAGVLLRDRPAATGRRVERVA